MLEFSGRQREVLIDKLADAANLALGGLLFAQFVSGQSFSTRVAFAGLATWIGLRGWTMVLAKEVPK